MGGTAPPSLPSSNSWYTTPKRSRSNPVPTLALSLEEQTPHSLHRLKQNCFSTTKRAGNGHTPLLAGFTPDAELKGSQWPGQEPATYPPILQEHNQAPTCGWQLHKSNLRVSFSEPSSHCDKKILAQGDSQGSHCRAKRDCCKTQAQSFLFYMYLEIMIAWLLTPRPSQLPLPAKVACSSILGNY